MERNKGLYKEIFKEAKYRKLLLANFIDRLGDSVDAIALTWIVYQITHSAAWSAIVFALNTLPNVLVQPFAGAIVEKLDKKKVVVATYFIRAAILSGFIMLYKFDMATPLTLAVFTLLITTVESFNLPASSAFAAEIIKKEHMTSGMSINTIFSRAASLIGTGIAGVIIAVLGVSFAMFIDVSSYIISAVLIMFIPYEYAKVAEKKQGQNTLKENVKDFTNTLKEGIVYVLETPVVRNFCVLCVVLNFMLVPLNALQAPIAGDIFGMGSELLSFAGVLSSIGGILGAALLPYISQKLSPLKTTISGMTVLVVGIALIPIGRFAYGNAVLSYATIGTSFFLMLVAVSLIGGTLQIQFMKSVEKEYMARASAVFNSSATAAMPVGSLLVGALVSYTGTFWMLVFCTVFVVAVLVTLIVTRPVLEVADDDTKSDKTAIIKEMSA